MAEHLMLVARITARPGQEENVKQALLALVGPTRGEAGCLNYDLHQSHADPAVFLFHENWTSQAALDAHSASPHIQAFRARAGELLAGPVLLEPFRHLDVAGR